MKGITYYLNGNRFLILKDEKEIEKLKNKCTNLLKRDLSIAMINGVGYFKGIDRSELEKKIREIEDIDLTDCQFTTEEARPELTYIEHPIKRKFFIPSDNYNKYIQDERKWDLINILRSMGVSKITFSKTDEVDRKEYYEISNFLFKNEIVQYYSNEEIYEFNNKPINQENNSQWLEGEPEWQGIIKALKNGLIKGSLSFTTEVSNASLLNFDESIQANKNIKIVVSKINFEI